MVRSYKNISMKSFNTMRIDSLCENLVEFDTVDDCPSAMALAENLSPNGNIAIIGGGSNILFSEVPGSARASGYIRMVCEIT